MNKFLFIAFCALILNVRNGFGQTNIFNPNDPVITYDSTHPPAIPPDNQIGKWVRTVRADFNTDKFKAYYYNGMAFRIRFPNGYDPADNTKKYPMILFFHGGGESGSIYDNEYHLKIEAQRMQAYADNGIWNGFLLFPQVQTNGIWDYFHFDRLNVIIDNLTANCHLDPDRVVTTGLSMGGLGCIRYSAINPRYSSVAIGSSPALIQTLTDQMFNNLVQIPVWVANGGTDTNPEPSIVDDFASNLTSRGGSVRHSFFPNDYHFVWEYIYNNPDIINYYNTSHKANPVVYNNKTQYAPGATVNSKMGLTSGFAEYQWRRNNADIPGAASNEYTATQLGSYTARFRRVAGGAWSDWSLVPAVISTQETITGPGNISGLAYKFYQGAWSSLPNFNALTPVKTGITPNIDISVRNTGVDDYFGFVWEGKIQVPNTGLYTFELSSDDGSKFYFNSYYSASKTPLINNDFVHGTAPALGASQYMSAGTAYPIALSYFESTLGQGIKLYWTGPGIPRQEVPNSAFANSGVPVDNTPPTAPTNVAVTGKGPAFINLSWTASSDAFGVTRYDIFENGTSKYSSTGTTLNIANLTPNTNYSYTVKAFDAAGNASALSDALAVTTSPAVAVSGLNYKYYHGDWDALPNYNTLIPVKTGVTPNLDLSVRNREDNFGLVWEGYLNLPSAGNYTFEIASDDGSNFYFNSLYVPGTTPTIANDGVHGAWYTNSATVNGLAAGSYPMSVAFFEKTGDQNIQLFWTGPGIARQLIPSSAFTTSPPMADSQAPTVPTGLTATAVTSTSVTLNWTASTDNIGVTRYDIYENGSLKYTSTTPNLLITGLASNTTYLYTVRSADQAGNVSAQSSMISPKTTVAVSTGGLNYRYYEGVWDAVPNFNMFTPVKTGVTPNLDMSIRNIDDNFGVVWEGYINLPTAGNYTFEIASDDGSKFYWNSLYAPAATPLITNDGVHGAWYTNSASLNGLAAGAYPISVAFFEKAGDQVMQLYWTGPGIPRQLVPASAYTTAPPVADAVAPSVPTGLTATAVTSSSINIRWDNSTDNVGVVRYDIFENGTLKYTSASASLLITALASNTTYTYSVRAADQAGNLSGLSTTISPKTSAGVATAGLNYRYYEGVWDAVPNFNTLNPVKTGTTPNIDLSVRNTDFNFGLVWEGYIKIPTAGQYTFEIASDDGSKFYWNTLYSPSATPLINNDGLHAAYYTLSATVSGLTVGSYPMSVAFFQKAGDEVMQLYWTGPGIPRQLVPNSAFVTSSVSVNSISGNATASALLINEQENAALAGNKLKITEAYPNPFINDFTIEYSNPSKNSKVDIQVYDMNGKLVSSKYFGILPLGISQLKMDVTGKTSPKGIYFARLNVDGVPVKVLKLIKSSK